MRLKDEEWDDVIAVDLTAGFRLTRAAVRGMMRKRFGRIISITSVVGVTGNAGQGNYAAAKAGLIGMTKSLAQEVASRGVTVNCIAPGFIETAMTNALNDKQKDAVLSRIPAQRFGGVLDVAAAAVFSPRTTRAMSPARPSMSMGEWRWSDAGGRDGRPPPVPIRQDPEPFSDCQFG